MTSMLLVKYTPVSCPVVKSASSFHADGCWEIVKMYIYSIYVRVP